MSAAAGLMALAVLAVLLTLAVAGVVLGVQAVLFGRISGRWLRWRVREPRLWGAGVLLLIVGWFAAAEIAVLGAGLVALAYAVKARS
ncbi:hypothetical protein ACIQ8G_15675 [Streptomyces sp. NPDC094154]|uniref:hypothetical protein n=1 Tax=unclassified Streptomyces TaxID=2593676 RepID=UPI0037FF52DB